MDQDKDIADLLDLSETSESDSSSDNTGVFETLTPFVLQLHDIRKDDPMATKNAPTTVAPDSRIKRHKKKKKGLALNKSASSVSSESLSEASSVAPLGLDTKEEFYDAHESYHGIPENQVPIGVAARLQVHSEYSQNTKTPPPVLTAPEQQTTTSTVRKETSAITKPTSPPE